MYTTRTIDLYIAGGHAGRGDVMRPAFHPEATIAGFCFGVGFAGGGLQDDLLSLVISPMCATEMGSGDTSARTT